MIIASKAAIDREQIKDRKKRGSNYLELHTIPKYFLDKDYTKEFLDILKEEKMECISVHSPIKNTYGTGCGVGYKGKVEEKVYLENMELIKKSILFAEKVIKGKRKICVVHVPETFTANYKVDLEKEKEYFLEDIKALSDFAKVNAPNVVIVIENTIKAKDKERKLEHMAIYGYKDEFVRWVEKANRKNVDVMLDICHLIATSNYRRDLGEKDFLTITEYVKSYRKKLSHIHLANSYNYGFLEDHGEAFRENKEDIAKLKELEEALNKINYKGNIVIETTDKNPNKYERYTITVNTILNNNIFNKSTF